MISPEMVLDAYEETGLDPIRCKFFFDMSRWDQENNDWEFRRNVACGLTALALTINSNIVHTDEIGYEHISSFDVLDTIRDHFDVDNHYLNSWIAGFDGTEGLLSKSIHLQAYKDGQETWRRLQEKQAGIERVPALSAS